MNLTNRLADTYTEISPKESKRTILSRPHLLVGVGNVKLMQGNICNDTDKLIKKLRRQVLRGLKAKQN